MFSSNLRMCLTVVKMNSKTLSAIASPRRRRLLQLMWDKELSAGELAQSFDVSWPAISQHLAVLKEAELVTERRQGRHRLYRSGPAQVGALADILQQMWSEDLDRLAQLAEAEQKGSG
jgi:DNA-binding transcriptional ArsR family regulator